VLSEHSATERFSGRGDDYGKFRPGYPSELIPVLFEGLSRIGKPIAVDVGAGTGISSAFLAKHGMRVIAIEPNDEMRDRGLQSAIPGVEFKKGTAENTGLRGTSAELVTAFQAFHWFNHLAALEEFHRIARPSGRVALVWNVRSKGDKFTQAYTDVVDRYADPSVAKELQSKEDSGKILFESPFFCSARRVLVPSYQRLNFEGLLGRLRSVSYLPRTGPVYEQIASEMKALFEKFARCGEIWIVYDTILVKAERRPD